MPRDQAVPGDSGLEGSGLIESLLARMPPAMQESFTAEQVAALRHAAWRSKFATHPVDIRWTIPFLNKPFYMVLLAGPERRSSARRQSERNRFPLARIGNLLFLAGLSTVGTIAGGIAFSAAFIWYLSLGL